MKTIKLFFIFSFMLSLISCKETEVKIGYQIWSKENLDVSTFRNGEVIPEAKTDAEWKRADEEEKPAWCYYDNNEENGKKYGKLYNWYAVNDQRDLAPAGWHIPTEDEIIQLLKMLAGEDTTEGINLKSKNGWMYNGNGTNKSGFNALPGGGRLNGGDFYNEGNSGQFWTSSEYEKRWGSEPNGSLASFLLLSSDADVGKIWPNYKGNGFSIRCIKDYNR